MMRHLLKLVWNRKRANALIMLEIFFTFLVVFGVGTLGMYLWDNWRRPLGFDWHDVWAVRVNMQGASDDTFTPEQVVTAARLVREVAALDPVEGVAGAMMEPFSFGAMRGSQEINGRRVTMDLNEVTEGFAGVLRAEVVRGRWFQPADAALSWRPAVIDEDLAREAWGGEDPVGKRLDKPDPGSSEPETRVIGVVRDFRHHGELSGPGNFLFYYKHLGDPKHRPPRSLLVRVRPGTPAAFEEELTRRMQGVARDWSFEVQPLEQTRETAFRRTLTPLIVGGIVAFFLLLMVALGLLGVLWQNLLQRTREIGLRRALGASHGEVRRQIVMEQLLITTLGVLLGAIVVVQLPVLDVFGSTLRPEVFTSGLILAMVSMYLLATVCALYPSAMASRVPPAEALRYE
ncbi:MAG TPA: FtsX-like permease family protein [Thermoanaerobaculia bacterium]|nr:FtsX-like permease family protein [Thermoanaerobaculia bacterium]